MSFPGRNAQLRTTARLHPADQSQHGVSGQRRTILSEEDYSEALSKVIRRNYFPDLNRLEAEVALQAAREGEDFGKVIATRRAFRRLEQHEEKTLHQEQAEEQDQNDLGLRNKPRPLDHEILTNFHLRVTSEDNSTFESNQHDEIIQRKEARLRDTRIAINLLTNGGGKTKDSSNCQKRRHPLVETPLVLASDDFNATPHRHVLTVQETEQASQTNNELFFPPSSVPRDNGPEKSLRRQQQEMLEWNQPARTDEAVASSSKSDELVLMPPPARNPSQRQKPRSLESSKKKTEKEHTIGPSVEYIPKVSIEKKICPAATRFAASTCTRIVTSLQDMVGGDGSFTNDDITSDSSSALTDLDATPRHSLETERRKAQKRKQRELETLVAMTPIILPGRNSGEGDNDEPLMTWGEVSSTPLVLSAHENEVGPTFAVAGKSSRETVADQARSALQARRRRAASASSIPKPQCFIRNSPLSTLTKKKTPTARSSSAFGTALRASYSRPSEGHSRPSSHMRERRTAHAATPDLFQPSKRRAVP